MSKNTWKINQKVTDSWYPEIGIGVIKKIFKTTMHIYFDRFELQHMYCYSFRPNKGVVVYDKPHYQFLKPFSSKTKK